MNDSKDLLLELLAREGRSLHAMLTRLTLDEQAAEDLLQELFLNADRSSGLRTAGNSAAYLRQMAIFLAFQWRRRRCRRERTAAEMPELVDPSPGAETVAMERELWQRILDGADTLSGISRDVFVMRYLQGLEFEEIAEHVGRTAHQVRALVSKAVADIRVQVRILESKEDPHVGR